MNRFQRVMLLSAVLASTYCITTLWAAGVEPVMVKMVNPDNLAVVTDLKGDALEVRAAGELARYLEQMTGSPVAPIDVEAFQPGAETYVIVVGHNKISVPLYKEMPERPDLKDDGFLVRTFKQEAGDYLMLAGGSGIGTLYAVYFYLEEFCGIGFFSDGDRVPQRDALPFPFINRTKNPRFPDRMTWWTEGYGGLYRGQMWDLDEWRQGIDWMAKNRLNTYWSGMGIYNTQKFPEYRRKIINEAFQYMKQRGIRLVHWDPDQTLDLLKKYFGDDINDDHLYAVGGGEGRERYANFLRRYGISKKLDPEIKRVYHDLWHLHGLSDSPELVKEYLTKFPPDAFVGPMDNLRKIEPHYKKYDYFWGREWYFAWLQGFGGGDFLGGHDGSLRRDVMQLREVARDPKAKQCRGMTLWSECSYHYYHPMYGFVLSRLAWDPLDVDPDGIFEKYARLRYGEHAAPNMHKSIREVLKWTDKRDLGGNWVTKVFVPGKKGETNTSYSPKGISYRDANEGFAGFRGDTSKQYKRVIKKAGELRYLRKALEYALLEKGDLNGDRFYEADLTEITRTYLSALFELHLVRMYQAYKEGVLSYRPGPPAELAPGEESKILYEQDFAMESLPSSWKSYSSPIGEPYKNEAVWAIDKGTLAEIKGGWGKKVLLNEETTSLKDYCLKVRFKLDKYCYQSFGVIFRAKSKTNFCSVSVEPYVGNLALRRTHSEEYVTGSRLIPGAVSADISLGQWHDIVIKVVGDNAKVYYDGWLKFDYSTEKLAADGSNNQGGIGFYLFADKGTIRDKTIHVDEIKVWVPEPPAEKTLPLIKNARKYKNNLERFEEEAEKLNAIMAALDRLLSTRPSYSLTRMLDQFKKRNDLWNMKSLKKRFVGPEWIVTYERRDLSEVVHLVYRQEVAIYIDELRTRLKNREDHFLPVTMRYNERLAEIAQAFMDKPFKFERFYPGTTTELVEEIYNAAAEW